MSYSKPAHAFRRLPNIQVFLARRQGNTRGTHLPITTFFTPSSSSSMPESAVHQRWFLKVAHRWMCFTEADANQATSFGMRQIGILHGRTLPGLAGGVDPHALLIKGAGGKPREGLHPGLKRRQRGSQVAAGRAVVSRSRQGSSKLIRPVLALV